MSSSIKEFVERSIAEHKIQQQEDVIRKEYMYAHMKNVYAERIANKILWNIWIGRMHHGNKVTLTIRMHDDYEIEDKDIEAYLTKHKIRAKRVMHLKSVFDEYLIDCMDEESNCNPDVWLCACFCPCVCLPLTLCRWVSGERHEYEFEIETIKDPE